MANNICSYDPKQSNNPGMFHCPECGEMVIGGIEHPDYSKITEPVLWHPRVNDTVAIQIGDKQLLGTFEGVLAIERTIPPSLPEEGLVRFIANEYDKYKDTMSQYECYNPNSKYSKLCVIPLSIIKEKDNSENGKPKGQTSGLARKAPNKR